jgi:exonuclease VII large subunit
MKQGQLQGRRTVPFILLLCVQALAFDLQKEKYKQGRISQPQQLRLQIAKFDSFTSTSFKIHHGATKRVSTSRYRRMSSINSKSNDNNASNKDDNEEEEDSLPSFDLPEEVAAQLQQQSEMLRQQIREMEEAMDKSRKQQQQERQRRIEAVNIPDVIEDGRMTLRNKCVLVAGANGRLGSMVCRYLLRNHPEIGQVIATVHVVGENSVTARGYARLSYEVGAEDGIGTIGPAWSSTEERTATFQFNGETMGDYNLNKLRIVECELLDPILFVKMSIR